MNINIKVSDLDVRRISFIGLKPWMLVTLDERAEYDRLINLYGTLVIKEVLKDA